MKQIDPSESLKRIWRLCKHTAARQASMQLPTEREDRVSVRSNDAGMAARSLDHEYSVKNYIGV